MTPIALVTGGSRGIGAAIVERLRADGWEVLAPTRSDLDLERPASIDAFLATIDTVQVAALINDAGINPIATLADIALDDWQRVQQVNVTAPLRLMQHVAPRMAAHGGGRIVNISSIYSFMGRAGRVSYGASKGALNQLTRMAAAEFGDGNVLVNAVAPGFVMTELSRRNNSPDTLERIRLEVPLRRFAAPADVAEVACFLVSSRNRYITGQVIVVDGGLSIV